MYKHDYMIQRFTLLLTIHKAHVVVSCDTIDVVCTATGGRLVLQPEDCDESVNRAKL